MNFLTFVVLCVAVVIASAEPPRFKSSRFQSRFLSRQEVDITTPAAEMGAEAPPASPPAEGGPYPASGWRPAGKPFELPSEKEDETTTPTPEYGAPEYGPPAETYGTPTTAPPATEFTTLAEEDGLVEPEAESIDDNLSVLSGRLRRPQRLQVQNAQAEEGALYILRSDSTLQKIYSPRSARAKSQLSGRLVQQAQPVFFSNQRTLF